jgi:hypothetical protein
MGNEKRNKALSKIGQKFYIADGLTHLSPHLASDGLAFTPILHRRLVLQEENSAGTCLIHSDQAQRSW